MKKITLKTNNFNNSFPAEITFVTTGEVCYKSNECPYIKLPIDACPLEVEFYRKLVVLGYLDESTEETKFYIPDTIKEVSGKKATPSEECATLRSYPRVHVGEYIKILEKYCNDYSDNYTLISESINFNSYYCKYYIIKHTPSDNITIYQGKGNYTFVIDNVPYLKDIVVLLVYEKSSRLSKLRNKTLGLVIPKKNLQIIKDYLENYC